MSLKRSQLFGFLTGLALMGVVSVFAGATFSRVKTWVNGEVLTASDLNAEFNNILNNLDPDGIDDYSVDTTEMRSTADPYPASSESLATSLEGELERLRYQILEIKKSMQASNVTYWYQDLPTAGFLTNTGTAIGIGDTTPDYTFDVEGGTIATAGNIVSDGNITTTGDDVDVSTHLAVAGNISVTGSVSLTGISRVVATVDSAQSLATDNTYTLLTFTEAVDTLGEFNGSTFTVTNSGNYRICASGRFSDDSASAAAILTAEMSLMKNGAPTVGTLLDIDGSFTWDAAVDVESMGLQICGIYVLSASDAVSVWGTIDDSTGNDANEVNYRRFSVERIL